MATPITSGGDYISKAGGYVRLWGPPGGNDSTYALQVGEHGWLGYPSLADLQSVSDQGRVLRLPRAIIADLFALTDAQRSLILSDLNGGSPPKWELSASIGVWSQAAIFRNTTGTIQKESLCVAVAFYCLENPNYLVHPSFDATINVPGDQPM